MADHPAAHGIDVVLVMDSSGSMKTNDPQRLRVPAAKLFISLLGRNDRVGVVSFSDDGYPVLGLTALQTAADRSRLFGAVDKVSSKGAYTNLYAALDRSSAMLMRDASAGRARYIILMSDGKMDTGDHQRDALLSAKLRGELLPLLDHNGTHVAALAFTPESDTSLLNDMATATHGVFRLARNDGELHPAFSAFFENTKNPDMLPIEGGHFQVDSAIQEVNIVAAKEKDNVRIIVEDPGGKRYDAKTPGAGMRWMPTARFDLIGITQPVPGDWKLLATAGQNKAYIVTDLGLGTNVKNQDVPLENASAVQAWLMREGQVLRQPDILTATQFLAELHRPDGQISRYSLTPVAPAGGDAATQGLYSVDLELHAPGNYELQLTAKNPTFERRIVRSLNVLPPAHAATATATPEPHATATPPPEPQATTTPAPAPTAGTHTHSEEETPSPPARAHPSLNLWLLLAVFTVMNLVIGGGALLVVLWLRKKNNKRGLMDQPDDELQQAADAAAPRDTDT